MLQIINYLLKAIEFIQSYGWFILIGALICYYYITNIKAVLQVKAATRVLRKNIPKLVYLLFQTNLIDFIKLIFVFKDEAATLKKMLEMEEARKRQQAAMDAAVAKFKEEQKLVITSLLKYLILKNFFTN